MIQCTDSSLYTGITINIEKRLTQHKNKQGAKYFRSHQPTKVVYLEEGHTRSSASKREWVIKKMTRKRKLELIQLQVHS